MHPSSPWHDLVTGAVTRKHAPQEWWHMKVTQSSECVLRLTNAQGTSSGGLTPCPADGLWQSVIIVQ